MAKTNKPKKNTISKKPITNAIRATKSNVGVASWYRIELEKLIKKMDRTLWRKLRPIWNKNATSINDVLKELAKEWQDDFNAKSKKLANAFIRRVNSHTTSSMKNALKDAGINVNKKPSIGVQISVKMQNTRAVQKVMTSLRDTQVKLIESIPREYHDKVAGIVQRGVQNGRDFKYIEKQLLKISKVTPKRARMIAFDQCNKATESIKMVRDEAIGITQGIWMHIPGRKTSRHTHIKMDGKVFNLRGKNAGLYDSDVGERVLPAQLVNCFCTYRPIIPETFGN